VRVNVCVNRYNPLVKAASAFHSGPAIPSSPKLQQHPKTALNQVSEAYKRYEVLLARANALRPAMDTAGKAEAARRAAAEERARREEEVGGG
jgi:hypothetical protein